MTFCQFSVAADAAFSAALCSAAVEGAPGQGDFRYITVVPGVAGALRSDAGHWARAYLEAGRAGMIAALRVAAQGRQNVRVHLGMWRDGGPEGERGYEFIVSWRCISK